MIAEEMLSRLQSASSDEERESILLQMTLESLDQELRQAVEVAAVPNWFDEHLLAVLIDRTSEEVGPIFERVRQLPFVEEFSGRGFNLHQRTRRLLRERLIKEDLVKFKESTARAAEFCAQRRCEGPIWQFERIYHLRSLEEIESQLDESLTGEGTAGDTSSTLRLAGIPPYFVDEVTMFWTPQFELMIGELPLNYKKIRVGGTVVGAGALALLAIFVTTLWLMRRTDATSPPLGSAAFAVSASVIILSTVALGLFALLGWVRALDVQRRCEELPEDLELGVQSGQLDSMLIAIEGDIYWPKLRRLRDAFRKRIIEVYSS